MKEEKNIELVKTLYNAIGKGDMPGALSLLQKDIEITLPGPSAIPFSGTYKGHDGFKTFASNLVESIDWDSRKLEAQEFIAQDNHVVVLGHENLAARSTGRKWDTDWVMVWTVSDGKIAKLREYHETASILAAFEGDRK